MRNNDLTPEDRTVQAGNENKTLECNKGEERLTSKLTLERHIQINGKQETTYECHICTQEFGQVPSLREYVYMHDKGGNLTCPQCQKAFTDKNNARIHFGRIHEGKTLYCTEYIKSSTGRDRLKTHLARHEESKDFTCDGCGEQCIRLEKIGEHGKKMHKECGSQTCPRCQKAFTAYSYTTKHIGPIQEEIMRCCTVCSKDYTERAQMKSHGVRHSDTRDFMCDGCAEERESKDKLAKHEQKMQRALHKKERTRWG